MIKVVDLWYFFYVTVFTFSSFSSFYPLFFLCEGDFIRILSFQMNSIISSALVDGVFSSPLKPVANSVTS